MKSWTPELMSRFRRSVAECRPSRSLDLDAGGGDDLAPAIGFAFDVGGEVFGGIADGNRALGRQLVLHLRGVQRFHGRGVQFRGDRDRGSRRALQVRTSCRPLRRGMPSSAVVGTSGTIGLRTRLPIARARSLPAWTAPEQYGYIGKHQLYVPAQQVVHGGGRPRIRQVDHIDAGCDLEQLRSQMRHASGISRRGENKLARLRFGERYQFGQRACRHPLAYNQYFRH